MRSSVLSDSFDNNEIRNAFFEQIKADIENMLEIIADSVHEISPETKIGIMTTSYPSVTADRDLKGIFEKFAAYVVHYKWINLLGLPISSEIKKSDFMMLAGGSVTTAAARSNWPAYVRGWLVNRFKDVRFSIINSAIGATGSLTGLALSQKEFIDTKCNLVFVEYAVNDDAIDSDERMRTREGLIRKLLAENIDIVIVYTFYQNMFKQTDKGELPDSIADFEKIAEKYNISSVYMANAAYEKVKKGIIPWNMWLSDGTHPGELGSSFYAEKVIEFLEQELFSENETETSSDCKILKIIVVK